MRMYCNAQQLVYVTQKAVIEKIDSTHSAQNGELRTSVVRLHAPALFLQYAPVHQFLCSEGKFSTADSKSM